ncbi:MAG TPA: hypothetical protein VGO43_10990 [Pyrinomonadaceae bacterium]|jgi:tetratricopeptide (TPR) repeat protein|nr:hypothetical protein [Pyrinomonadaceae bacterium]
MSANSCRLWLVFIIVLTSSVLVAQPAGAGLQTQITKLIEQKNYRKALSLTKEQLKSERERIPVNHEDIGSILTNIARLSDLVSSQGVPININEIDLSAFKASARRFDSLNQAVESSYKEAISYYEQHLPLSVEKIATLKIELATKIIPPKTTGRGESYEKAAALRESAYHLLITNFPLADERSLAALLSLADFYEAQGEFGQSLPLYKRFIEMGPTLPKNKGALILSALRECLAIATAIGDTGLRALYAQKLADQTGRSNPEPEILLDITPRLVEDYNETYMRDPSTSGTSPKKMKSIFVKVLVSSVGKVLTATAENTQDSELKGKPVAKLAESTVLKWRFRPLMIAGSATEYRGNVEFVYLTKS